MIDKQKVTTLLEETIKPLLQLHGGNLELVEITDDGLVKVNASDLAAYFTGFAVSLA